MIEIPLINGGFTIVDDDQFELTPEIKDIRWRLSYNGDRTGFKVASSVLVTIDEKRVRLTMARVIMQVVDPKVFVDHINGNPLDNRKVNLRRCSVAENSQNLNKSRRKKSTSVFKGVSKSRKMFRAYVCINYKNVYLGSFACEEAAARAYDAKAIRQNE